MAKRVGGKGRGNKDIWKHGFRKDNPESMARINRKGAPKKLPILQELMSQLLGHTDGDDLSKSEIAEIVTALIKLAKTSGARNQVSAADVILTRAFGKPTEKIQVSNPQPIVWNETKTYEQKKKSK